MAFVSLNETFSSTLRELMCEHGISQRELARKTGVSAAMINYYCQGLKFPKAQTLYYIAQYFNVSMEYLLTGED